MKAFLIRTWLISILSGISTLSAETYISFSTDYSTIDTPAASTHPLLADFRYGYTLPGQQIELALMTSLKDDELNQLSVDIPLVASVFYRYIPDITSSIKVHLIVGASYVEVDSSYPGLADSSDSFDGLSYGLGFVEAFQSIPQLRLTLDWIQLYDGSEVDIDTFGLGVRYDF